jgi:murein L,D-transpeptidase YcbB/YkuD
MRVVMLGAALALCSGLAAAPVAQAATPPIARIAVSPAVFGCNFTSDTPTLYEWSPYTAAVEEAQCLLNYWGVSDHVTVDGSFGPATLTAVKQFQSTFCSLTVDGIVGPATWRALKTSGC